MGKKNNKSKTNSLKSLKRLMKGESLDSSSKKNPIDIWAKNLIKKETQSQKKQAPAARKLRKPSLTNNKFLISLKSRATTSNKIINSVEHYNFQSRELLSTDQLFDGSSGLTEIVIGLDFGTTTSKVVVMEQGSKMAWAVPFTDSPINPYLLPSNIYFNEGDYSLESPGKKIQDLKKSLLESTDSRKIPEEVIAYLALVINYAKSWFLDTIASTFSGFEFEWLINIGMPAADYNNKDLVHIFKTTLQCAADVSLKNSDTLSNRLIFSHLSSLNDTEKQEWETICSAHPETLDVFPEIAAQLHGYVNSDRWDSRRPKFMLVDVGGSTVDASIVNVTNEPGTGLKYSFLRSKVTFQGAVILHRERINWIKNNVDKTHKSWSTIEEQLDAVYNNFNQMAAIPDHVSMYLENATFPVKNSKHDFDNKFYNDYGTGLYDDIISPVRNYVDTNHSQWGALQFLLCGGGSLHPIYNRFVRAINTNYNIHVRLDQSRIEMPDNLIADDLNKDDYHRLSVAYGLAHENLGTIIAESNINSANSDSEPESTYRDNFISKDQM